MSELVLEELVFSFSIFAASFGCAAFAGLATFLRFTKKITKLRLVSTMLNSGFLGLAIALLWYKNFQEDKNIYSLVGICVLSGMGGSTLTDALISLLGAGGLRINIIHEREQHAHQPFQTDDDSGE
jgi:hypothetical protein